MGVKLKVLQLSKMGVIEISIATLHNTILANIVHDDASTDQISSPTDAVSGVPGITDIDYDQDGILDIESDYDGIPDIVSDYDGIPDIVFGL